jgi:hypothetical protein
MRRKVHRLFSTIRALAGVAIGGSDNVYRTNLQTNEYKMATNKKPRRWGAIVGGHPMRYHAGSRRLMREIHHESRCRRRPILPSAITTMVFTDRGSTVPIRITHAGITKVER